MAGVSNAWTESDAGISSHPMPVFTLDGVSRVSLVFMRLPDGNSNGSGFATHGNQSLQELLQGTISSIDAVNGSSSYTATDLVGALTALMTKFQPDVIRTQDSVVGFGHGDHSDHYASALFADSASSAYATPHTTVSYIDYGVSNYPQNVFGTDLTGKENAFYTYGGYDSHTCHSAETCLTKPERDWLARSYLIGTPNANAGGDQTALTIGATVHLNGSASSDPNGDPITYSWAQTAGSPSVTLSGASTATPTFVVPAAATTLTFALTVSDGSLSSTDNVTVTVAPNSANVAGLAIATASTAAAGQPASSAIDGFTDGYPLGNATHEWSTAHERAGAWLNLAWSSAQTIDRIVLYDRPNSNDQITSGTLTFSDGSTVDVPALANNGFAQAISFPAVTTTSVKLTITSVSDSTTNIGLAEIEAWTPADRAPVANAGPNQTVDAASLVTLAGTASSDPDSGDTLSYTWTQTGGPTVTLSNIYAVKPTFTAPAEGDTLTFQLTVNDGVLSDSSSVTITVTPKADLKITKTDSPDPVLAAETLTYTLAVSNQGPSTATNLQVVDTLPSGTSFVSASGTDWACNQVSGTVTCTRAASLAVGAAPDIQIQVTAPDQGGSISNTATVSATENDPVSTNNSATEATSVTPKADLSITKTDGKASVGAGSSTTYTIRVTNNGPSSVTGAILSDPSATGLSKTALACSATTPGQCVTPPTKTQLEGGSFALPALASGDFYELTVSANVSATSGSVSNAASVTAPAGTTDPTPGNNSATDTDSVGLVSDLSITKTDGVIKVGENSTVSYTIVASNAGPSDASGAVFKDAAVANLSVSTVTCGTVTGGAICPTTPNTTNVLMQNAGIVIPTLPSGGSVTFTVTGTAGSGAQIANTATLAPPSGTVDPSPASATDTDAVNRAPVANAGPDQSVSSNASVTLDGSSSSDPDGDTLIYAWAQTGGPTVTLSNIHAVKPTFTAPAVAGALTFKLTVSDGLLTSSDSVGVTVSGSGTPAVKKLGRPQTTLLEMKIGHVRHTAFFRFTGSGGKGKLKFECRLDTHHFSPCRLHKSFKQLKRGRHVFRVRARDAAGKADLTLVTVRFKV